LGVSVKFWRIDTAAGPILDCGEVAITKDNWFGIGSGDDDVSWYSAFTVIRIKRLTREEYDGLMAQVSDDETPEAEEVDTDQDEAYRKHILGIGNNAGRGLI
jgi:hypothetical protein